MPKRYPKQIDEAIWALLCEGIGPAQIRRELASGRATGKAVDMPERTMTKHVRDLKLERGDPRYQVEPGSEIDAARAIVRAGLEELNRQIERLRGVSRGRAPDPMKAQDIETLRRCTATAQEIHRRLRQEQREAGKLGTQQQAGGRKLAGKSSLLERLARTDQVDQGEGQGRGKGRDKGEGESLSEASASERAA